MNCWLILGIEPTTDEKQIKRAYASLLRQTRPEDDPLGYQRLREAFDTAVTSVRAAPRQSASTPAHEQPPQAGPEADPRPAAAMSSLPSVEPIRVESPQERQLREELAARERAQEAERSFLQRALGQVFDEEDENAAIRALQVVLSCDEMQGIALRARFESACLHIAVQHQANADFPVRLFARIGETFGWFEGHVPEGWSDAIRALDDRLRAGLAWYRLKEISAGRGPKGVSRAQRKVAQAVAGPLRPFAFHLLRFRRTHYQEVITAVEQWAQLAVQGLCPEAETASVHWWLDRRDHHAFTSLHFIPGFLLGFALALYLLSGSPMPPWVLVGAPALAVPVGAVAAWALCTVLLRAHRWLDIGLGSLREAANTNWRMSLLLPIPYLALFVAGFLMQEHAVVAVALYLAGGWVFSKLHLYGGMALLLSLAATLLWPPFESLGKHVLQEVDLLVVAVCGAWSTEPVIRLLRSRRESLAADMAVTVGCILLITFLIRAGLAFFGGTQ